MKEYLLILKKPKNLLGSLVRAALMMLAGLIIMPVAAQFNGSDNYILISGQITNNVNGAPIADHDIYITSDSTANLGLNHYAIVKTDVNGFYRDTIVTHLEDGVIHIFLYDFYENIVEADKYFRFTWSDKYQMFADFAIFDPNASNNLQANFRSEKDTLSGNEMSVVFRDMTSGYKIKSWCWDFGDGNHSFVQDPTHMYEEPGIYIVSLTVSAFPPSYESNQTSTIVKQVKVGLTDYYHMGGHVFTGLFPPIDLGMAYLYEITEEDGFVPIDTTTIDTLGYYYFMSLKEGTYTTKTRLDEASVFYGQYIPTYLGNVLSWEQSDPVILDKNNFECNINLIESVGIPYGKGQIVGEMLYDTSLTSYPLVPADDIEVVLLGVEGAHITCKVSDLFGSFIFDNLAYGTYQLYPDVAGVPTSTMFITISEEKPVAGDFSLVISDLEVTYLGIQDPGSLVENVTSIYPNPAKDVLKMDILMKESNNIQLMIVDQSGRCVLTTSRSLFRGNNQMILDVSDLAAGFYQVIIASEGKYGFSGKFVKTY